MNKKLEMMEKNKGFVAALDQSGGSTPRALKLYGIDEGAYSSEEEMFDLVHAMRSRIIKSPAFNSDRILAAILFEMTMDRKIDGSYSADYLWNKGILSILKVDRGLAQEEDGVQLMKPMEDLEELLSRAQKRNIFGTKMRSVIKKANEEGIKKIVAQQFEMGKLIFDRGFIPILEPEVDINSPSKEEAEVILKREILKNLGELEGSRRYMFKLTLPSQDNFYEELTQHERVVRLVALSGGYSRKEANGLLSKNPGMIASFSRALTEGLSVNQSDEDFDRLLDESIQSIYQASLD